MQSSSKTCHQIGTVGIASQIVPEIAPCNLICLVTMMCLACKYLPLQGWQGLLCKHLKLQGSKHGCVHTCIHIKCPPRSKYPPPLFLCQYSPGECVWRSALQCPRVLCIIPISVGCGFNCIYYLVLIFGPIRHMFTYTHKHVHLLTRVYDMNTEHGTKIELVEDSAI